MSEASWHRPLLLVGATSGIARALAEQLASQGQHLLLAGRDRAELEAIAADLRVRFETPAAVLDYDALDPQSAPRLLNDAAQTCGGALAGVIVCHGTMVERQSAGPQQIRQMIEVNYSACVDLLEAVGDRLAEEGGGLIVAVSSVAGDRGRPSNYLYGSMKAALSAYLQGLRARLAKANVLTVKPGIVATPMTWGLAVKGPIASPQRVARDIARAMRRRRNVLYTPWYWRPIMAVIRAIPEPIFKRLDL